MERMVSQENIQKVSVNIFSGRCNNMYIMNFDNFHSSVELCLPPHETQQFSPTLSLCVYDTLSLIRVVCMNVVGG